MHREGTRELETPRRKMGRQLMDSPVLLLDNLSVFVPLCLVILLETLCWHGRI